MRAVLSKGNRSTENIFRSALKRFHIKYWRTHPKAIFSPDFIFPRKKLAIYLDGCFWHGCKRHLRLPRTNVSYWENKIFANVKRDRTNRRLLKGLGWRVIRIWEHSLKNADSVQKQMKRLKRHL